MTARFWQARYFIILLLTALLLSAGWVVRILGQSSTFTIVASPNIGVDGNVLNAVAALNATDAWAVGFRGSNNENSSRTLIQHWDGSQWTVVNSPNPGSPPACSGSNTGNMLTGVASVSSSNVWTVGYSFTCTAPSQHLILHWNGLLWTTVPMPSLSSSEKSALNGVFAVAPNIVWAVGYQSAASGAVIPLIELWNGVQWRVVEAPAASATGNYLTSVSGTGPSDVWAVGYSVDQPTNSMQTLTMHYDGSQWNIVPSPNVLPMDSSNQNILSSVKAIAPDDVTAVGHILDFQNARTLTMIQHWDGVAWSVVPSPNPSDEPGTFNVLKAVSGFSPDNLYAAGYFANSSTIEQHRTLIQHWNGATWTILPVTGPSVAQQLLGIFALPGTADLWTVGGYSNLGTEVASGLLRFPRTLIMQLRRVRRGQITSV